LRQLPVHAPLPWDHVDSLVKKEHLVRDRHAGMRARFLPACEKPFIPRDPNKQVKPLEHANLVCYHCGLDCDLEAIKQERIAQRDSLAHPGAVIDAAFRGEAAPAGPADVTLRLPPAVKSDGLTSNAFEAANGSLHGETPEGPGAVDLAPHLHVAGALATPPAAARHRYRVWYAKTGDLRWLSHLDLVRALQRGFRRAGIPVTYSQGFHPGPLMSFGPALALGMEGSAEVFDFESSQVLDADDVAARLRTALPADLRVSAVQALAAGAPPLSRCIDLGEYRAWIDSTRRALTPELFATLDRLPFTAVGWQQERIAALLQRPQIVVVRADKEGKSVDVRPFIADVRFLAARGEVVLWLRLGSQGQARPQEVLEALYDVPGPCFRVRRVQLGAAATLAPAPLELASR
jgi:radical SAM-linked protein